VLVRSVAMRCIRQVGVCMVAVMKRRAERMGMRMPMLVVVLVSVRMAVHEVAVTMLVIVLVSVQVHVALPAGAWGDRRKALCHQGSPRQAGSHLA
jgi:hypothetical protein